MTTKKITRKELKAPDEFLTTTATVLDFVQEHQKQFLLGAAALAVAAVLVAAGFAWQQHRTTASREALGEAQAIFDARLQSDVTTEDPARPGEKLFPDAPTKFREAALRFSEVGDRFGRTDAGKLALLIAAEAAYRAGEYDQAILSYQRFLETFAGDPFLEVLAHDGLGYAFEAKKEYVKAAEEFEKTTDAKYPEQRPLGLLSAARCHALAGNADRAATLYEQVVTEFPNSPLRQLAADQLALLRMKKG